MIEETVMSVRIYTVCTASSVVIVMYRIAVDVIAICAGYVPWTGPVSHGLRVIIAVKRYALCTAIMYVAASKIIQRVKTVEYV